MKNTGLPDAKNCNRFKNFSKFAKRKSEAKNGLKSKFDPILIDFSLRFFANHFFSKHCNVFNFGEKFGKFYQKNREKYMRKINQNQIRFQF